MSNNKVFVSKLNLQAIWAEIKTALDSKADADSLSTYVAQCSDILSQVQTAGSDATTKIANLLGAQDYDSTSTYAEGAYCFYNSNFYRCSTAISTPESWNSAHWTQISITSESARILQEIQAEGATQVANVQSIYADDMAEVNAKVSRNTKEIANLVQKEGEVSISYPDSIYGRGEVPSGMAKYAEVSCLRGVSRVGNQLCPTATISTTKKGLTITSSNDGTISISGTTSEEGAFDILANIGSTYSGHTYLIGFGLKVTSGATPSGSTYGFKYGDSLGSGFYYGDYVATASATVLNTQDFAMNIYAMNVSVNITITPIITDLTTYFGGTVPSNAQTIADIQQNYPELLEPSDYDAGSLVDITYSAVESEGVNLWDEEWEAGDYSNSGVKIPGEGIRSADKIKVSEHETYFLIGGITWWICEYDANETFITRRAVSAGNNYIPTSGTHYIAFNTASAYGGVYNHDLQICYSSLDISIKSTYHPYMKSVFTLPSPVTLPSAGSVADTDELCVEVSEGVFKRRQTRNVASVDLSTITFTYNVNLELWLGNYVSGVPFSTQKKNLFYHIGLSASYAELNADPNILGYYMNDSTASSAERIYIRNGSNSVAPTGILYYESPNPTVTLTDPILDNFLPTEAGGTITPKQTQSKQIDTSFDIEYLAL